LHALDLQVIDHQLFEVIVVSDGPDAATQFCVDNCRSEFSFDLLYKPLPKKAGPAAARNLGWQHANADLIAFTDDDTLPEPIWLKAVLQSYQGEEYIAYSGRVIVPLPENPTDYELNTAGLETAEFITANCACTKKALELVEGFDERFRMAWREDSDLEFKLLLNNVPIHKLHEAVIIHPVRKAPFGVSIKEQKKGMFNALLFKKYPSLYREKIQPHPVWNYYAMLGLVCTGLLGILEGSELVAYVAFGGFTMLWLQFLRKRLQRTSHSTAHILEMAYTSLVIPFVSVYWQIYGAIKYRVYFL